MNGILLKYRIPYDFSFIILNLISILLPTLTFQDTVHFFNILNRMYHPDLCVNQIFIHYTITKFIDRCTDNFHSPHIESQSNH